MAKELDPQALVEKFEKEAAAAQKKVDALNGRRPALVEKAEKAQRALADLDVRVGAEQAKVDSVNQKIEWARSMPVASNAPVVTADQEFGDAESLPNAEDEGAPAVA